jgi:hypothetical protein
LCVVRFLAVMCYILASAAGISRLRVKLRFSFCHQSVPVWAARDFAACAHSVPTLISRSWAWRPTVYCSFLLDLSMHSVLAAWSRVLAIIRLCFVAGLDFLVKLRSWRRCPSSLATIWCKADRDLLSFGVPFSFYLVRRSPVCRQGSSRLLLSARSLRVCLLLCSNCVLVDRSVSQSCSWAAGSKARVFLGSCRAFMVVFRSRL